MIYLDPEKAYAEIVGRGFDRVKLVYAIAEQDESDDVTATLARSPICFN